MDYYQTKAIKKTSNQIGFLVLISFIIMIAVTYIGIAITHSADAIVLWSGITSLVSMFTVGVIFIKATDSKFNDMIPLKKVKKGYFVPLVLIATAVSLISNYMADILLNNLSLIGIKTKYPPSFEAAENSPLEALLTILSVAIIPPLAEEFLFRGIILNKLKPFGINFAIFTSSLLFGLMHGNLVQTPFAFVVGMAFAYVTVKSGSILPSIISHFLINFSSVMVSMYSDSQLDDNIATIVYISFSLIVIIGGIVSAFLLSKHKGFFNIYPNVQFKFGSTLRESLTAVGMILSIIALTLELIASSELWGLSFI